MLFVSLLEHVETLFRRAILEMSLAFNLHNSPCKLLGSAVLNITIELTCELLL